MVKKLAIYCVTYNSYDSLQHFVESISKAAERVGEWLHVDVYVADNTEKGVREIPGRSDGINVAAVKTTRNLGYFGAVKYAMQKYAPEAYDFVAVSNVDLIVSEDAFVNLVNLGVDDNIGCIAPQIYSCLEKRDRNPKILHRYSYRKLELLRLKFRYPVINYIYNHTLYKRKKYTQQHSPMDIYAGHGSFIILTREYMARCGIIDYPVFLFCEEIYIAEQCRSHGLRVRYEPSVAIMDEEHLSTGSMKNSFYNRCNVEGLTYVIDHYYKQKGGV